MACGAPYHCSVVGYRLCALRGNQRRIGGVGPFCLFLSGFHILQASQVGQFKHMGGWPLSRLSLSGLAVFSRQHGLGATVQAGHR